MRDQALAEGAADRSAAPAPADEPTPTGRSRVRAAIAATAWADWAMVMALVALLIVGGALSSVFLSVDNLSAILLEASVLAVVTVGQSYVMATAGMDLSIGGVIQLASALLGVGVAHAWPFGASIALAVMAACVVGIVSGTIIVRGRINDFIVTLGTMSAAGGLALLISDAKQVPMSVPFLSDLATGSIGPVSYLVFVAVAVAVVGHVVMFHTRFGTYVLAVGGNAEAATDMGLSIARIKVAVYALSGALAGLGAMMITARLGSADPTAGSTYVLNSIAAAVLGGVSLFGGRASIVGPCLGAILLAGILNLLNVTGTPVYYQPIVVGVVVVLSAWIRRYDTA